MMHIAFRYFLRECTSAFTAFQIRYIENNTRVRVDMEYLFECSTRNLTSELSERVRYQVEMGREIPCLQATIYYFVDFMLHDRIKYNVLYNTDHSPCLLVYLYRPKIVWGMQITMSI